MRSHASTAVNFPPYPFLIERQGKDGGGRGGYPGGAKDHCYKSREIIVISRGLRSKHGKI